jgi:CBS domain-containing membrane protein
MITIEEFMTSEPCILHETDSINDAWKIMTEKHIRHIPITDSDNQVLGIITQRDVLAATYPGAVQPETSDLGEAGSATQLSEIMIRNVSIVHKKDSLRQAAVYLQEHKYGCLPVVSDDRLVGIITDSDFIGIAINLLEQVELLEEETGVDDVTADVALSEVNESL